MQLINHWFNILTKLINLKTTNASHTITKELEELLLRLLIFCMMIEDSISKSPLLMLICLIDNSWSNSSSILIFQSALTFNNLKTEFSLTEYCSLRLLRVQTFIVIPQIIQEISEITLKMHGCLNISIKGMNFQGCMVLDSNKAFHQILVREGGNHYSKIIGTEPHPMKNIGKLMANWMFRQIQI